MGIFAKLFNKEKKTENQSLEYKEIIEFNSKLKDLFNKDYYIAKSDYLHLVNSYNKTFDYFSTLQKSMMLEMFCKKNKVKIESVEQFLQCFSNIETVVENRNNNFIKDKLVSEEKYFDNVLKEVDKNIKLDEEQRTAILTDEDYCLIIAGAGAGKTTTVAAKVKYLVEKRNINPKEILVISFTNKAVNELKERINQNLGIDCPITTFHSTGYAILKKQEDEKKTIVDSGFLYNAVNSYLKERVLNQPEIVDKLILFFSSYFDAPFDGNDLNVFFNYIAKADFSTLKSNINEYTEQLIDKSSNKLITISNEFLKSHQEVEIANFLYLNGIDYKYEDIYPYHILQAKKPYTPDFCICQGGTRAYIEHFGITESGHHSFYTAEQLEKYKKEIEDKVALHKKHKTVLITTYSQYNDGRDLLEHLSEELIKNGFVLNKRDSKEVFEKIVNNEENRYISKFVKFVIDFINNFKTDGYNIDDFYRFERNNSNVRTKLFLDICKECYLEYSKKLSESNAVDFQDMINDSARILREKQIAKERLAFKYIIVDEYQDISRQRFDLTKELSKLCDAKVIAVGDDWQSIYAFSGSDITLFTHFCQIMGYGKELKITKTYRNAQEVIDIAGNFVQKNDTQIKKSLISSKRIQKPVFIKTYSEDYDKKDFKGKGGKYYHLGKILEETIGQILELNKREGKNDSSNILLIGRFNFDAKNLCFSKDFVYDDYNKRVSSKKYPNAKLEFLTAHSSKGLGYDNVVIVNARNEIYGFPAKIDTDPIMKYVIRDDNSIDYAEERRLFYVALTRTKNRVFIVTPQQHPSEFILELLKDYSNISLSGELNKSTDTNIGLMKKCPICGYPLQYRYNKNYGLKLWICTNEPEICNFISNDLRGGTMSIQKCDRCKDGYLIVKKTTNNVAVLGCTNYRQDGTGCDKLILPENYQVPVQQAFENDEAFDKPQFKREEVKEIKIERKQDSKIESKVEDSPIRKKAVVNKAVFVSKDDFEVLATDDGTLITDMDLLFVLKSLRTEIMKEEDRPAYTIIGNKGLVSLATYKPTSKEEFISLYGLGETTYNNYGKLFIKSIIDYYDKGGEIKKDKVKNFDELKTLKTEENSTCKVDDSLIGLEGFDFITNSDGEILTDIGLLKYLKALRLDIMIDSDRPAYTIVGNKGLVSLATYKPQTKEDFILLYGLGEKTYNAYGEFFIRKINEYLNK